MKDKAKKGLKILKVVYIISVIMLLAVSLILYFYVRDKTDIIQNGGQAVGEEGESEEVKKENRTDILVENYGDSMKKVSNVAEGFSVDLPSDWSIQYGTDDALKLKVYRDTDNINRDSMDFTDGSMVWIYVYNNKESLTLEEWIKKEEVDKEGYVHFNFQNYESLRREEEAKGDLDVNLNYILMEKSVVVNYLVSVNDKVYKLNCVSLGDKYQDYSEECEKILININFKND
ncbi:MAG: hypothetical protein WC178_05080 [Candidatus Paceibacterota bacterium]